MRHEPDLATQRAAGGEQTAPARACLQCLRRSWLLAMLSVPLEYRCRGEGRLAELLALSDEELLESLGGRRRAELQARHARFDGSEITRIRGVEAVCVHDHQYPAALCDRAAPRMLSVAGGVERLARLTGAPAVAIVGSSRASDYGMEMTRCLARGLAASGLTVVGGLGDGIAVAAHAGAHEVAAGTVAVLGGGVDVACPARRRSLYERVCRRGCAVAELPCGFARRRWAQTASARILVGLAALTIVVEARDDTRELASARTARALGRTVAAVPGRATSPCSRGTNALLKHGAHLVRGPQDVLELLHGAASSSGAGTHEPPASAPVPAIGRGRSAPRDAVRSQTRGGLRAAALPESLRVVLERVGDGLDGPDELTARGEDVGETMLALAELELMGLLARGDGGRYVPRESLADG